jgi:hypothetical protein
MNTMKRLFGLLVVLFVAGLCQAQPNSPRPSLPLTPLPGSPPALPTAAKDPVNYRVRIEWKDAKSDATYLEVLTTEGHVEFDGLQKNSVKINNNDVPVTLKLSGTLNVLTEETARLQLFLGRTVPYVTGSGSSSISSYSQISVGLQSTFIVKFGKPVAIQNDENGTITVLVKRLAD